MKVEYSAVCEHKGHPYSRLKGGHSEIPQIINK